MKRARSIYEIYEHLPKTNCGQCGTHCMGFAGYLLARDVRPADCPGLCDPAFAESRKLLEEMLGSGMKNERTGLIVYDERCIGCGICVSVCPVHGVDHREVAVGKGPRFGDGAVIEIVDGRVRLARPERCNRAVPSAPPCKACADFCPTDAMELV